MEPFQDAEITLFYISMLLVTILLIVLFVLIKEHANGATIQIIKQTLLYLDAIQEDKTHVHKLTLIPIVVDNANL